MRFLTRLPVKLAAIFLVLIGAVGISSVIVAIRLYEKRQVEIDQLLNANVASSMAAEIQPFVSEAGESGQIGETMHYMMVMNPDVEIYLLDGDGHILDYFATPGPPVQLDRVDTEPIEEFLAPNRVLPILGENPRGPAQRHHFSAARIDLGGGESGYLYVILHSSEYDVATMGLQRQYLVQALQTSMLITLPLVAFVGLIGFFAATRPLQKLSATMHAFGSGDYAARSDLRGSDEIGELASRFNTMADTIVENVDRLARADRERRELIANISHDLRNPLATIQGYLETLWEKQASLSEEERARYYDILLSTARSVPRLVDDLFDLSRLEDPDNRPQMESFSMSELVQDVAMSWQSRAVDAEVELSAAKPAGLYMVSGNIGLVERVLTNLVRNALTHTPAGGSIRIAVEPAAPATDAPGSVMVSVSDTGPGIDPDNLPRVFDRFFIGDDSRSRSREGSGLGLAICKRIVELHGGRIWVDSTPGEGSSFRFILPLVA